LFVGLADRQARQFGADVEGLGRLVVGEPLAAPGVRLVDRRPVAGQQFNEGMAVSPKVSSATPSSMTRRTGSARLCGVRRAFF
jgi:hypothetical protein